jgi:hypothetical protein
VQHLTFGVELELGTMELTQLITSAKTIVRRNLSANVGAASIQWYALKGKLVLAYYMRNPHSEDDEEWCSLALAELEAEFPDIRLSELLMLPFPDFLHIEDPDRHVVYESYA